MKVLYFTKYTSNGASSRMRHFQYFPFLEKEGILVSVSPLFYNDYLESLYSGKLSKMGVLKAYFRRAFKLLSIWKYDKIVIEYELFPYLPAWGEIILSFLGISYVVDYDDAIFHNYDLSSNVFVRYGLGDKIDKVMRYSDIVVAGNNYLAERAKKAGSLKIVVIPTVIDLNRYQCKKTYTNQRLVIGWIGSPSTYKYVKNISKVLKAVAEKNNCEIRIIGAYQEAKVNGLFHFLPWQQHTEAENICEFDIGIMPLEDTPWELGKCSYKLIQYMACGIPLLASPVGMNKEVIVNDFNGRFAKNEADWISEIEGYINNPDKRISYGLNGRKLVEDVYCVQQTYKKWIQLLKCKM